MMVGEVRLILFKVMLKFTCFGLVARTFYSAMLSAERTQRRILGKYLEEI